MMEAIIPIVERLGSLGILVLMVWRAPSIITAIKDMLGSVTDKIAAIQEKSLNVFEKQQEAERKLFEIRFASSEKTLEKIGDALETTMRTQTEILHNQTEMRNRLEQLEKK
jgi:hypothetical protein